MTRHRKSDCRCNEHKGEPDNTRSKKSSKGECKEKTPKEKRDDTLTPEEEKRLREKYKEIKRRIKEDRKITKTYEAIRKIKKEEVKRKLVRTARSILDESSSEDKRQRKKKQTDSSSESQKKTKRKYRVKMIRVTGCSNEEERRILTEKEEEEVTERTDDDDEEQNPINSQQENPPSPPTPRRSPRTPENRNLFQELRSRIVDNIDALIEDEDDEVTLHQGSEDEGFKSCQPDFPSKDESEKHLDKERAIDIEASIKAQEYIEATKKGERYNHPEKVFEVRRLYDVLRDEHSLTKELYDKLKEIHGYFLKECCEEDDSDYAKEK